MPTPVKSSPGAGAPVKGRILIRPHFSMGDQRAGYLVTTGASPFDREAFCFTLEAAENVRRKFRRGEEVSIEDMTGDVVAPGR